MPPRSVYPADVWTAVLCSSFCNIFRIRPSSNPFAWKFHQWTSALSLGLPLRRLLAVSSLVKEIVLMQLYVSYISSINMDDLSCLSMTHLYYLSCSFFAIPSRTRSYFCMFCTIFKLNFCYYFVYLLFLPWKIAESKKWAGISLFPTLFALFIRWSLPSRPEGLCSSPA